MDIEWWEMGVKMLGNHNEALRRPVLLSDLSDRVNWVQHSPKRLES